MQFISKALIRFSISAFSVHVSHPYRTTDVISARSKPILVFMDMFLSLQMTFSFARDAVATANLIFFSCTDLASFCNGRSKVLELSHSFKLFTVDRCIHFITGFHFHYFALFCTNLYAKLFCTLFQSSC